MTSINAFKMDGLGNDFIIIDRRTNFVNLTKEKKLFRQKEVALQKK